MEQKLNSLYSECVKELNGIGIDILNEEKIGKININLSKRKNNRYGCCKQENPDKQSRYIENHKIKYAKYNSHNIEISNWVMQLNNDIIKNTIIHELIHCIPFCNNHGKNFKQYAKYINEKLGYDISRLGNREEDYKKSNVEYNIEKRKDRYKIKCEECGQVFFRQRIAKNFTRKYRCGKCNGKLKVTEIENKK